MLFPMAMKLSKVLAGLREVAPEALAEPWDKVGLQVGAVNRQVKSALLCIDLTEAVVAEAVSRRCQLVVAYHPPIFHSLTRLVEGKDDLPGAWKERALVAAVRHRVAVYSPHTALDAVRGGMNDWLCAGLGKGAVVPIVAKAHAADRDEYKIVTFVPGEHADAVRDAMDRGGAGWIGNYRHCSFNAPGVGTFKPLADAKPAVGKVGELAWVEELRIEMICAGDQLTSALAALREAHPYEEPAIDVFKLETERTADPDFVTAPGAGRAMRLAGPILAKTLADRVKQRLGLNAVKLATPKAKTKIRTVAVCVGAGGSLFEKIEADAYVTGEMQHHQVLDLLQRGKTVVLAGHTNTERPFLPVYREKIRQTDAAGVRWRLSRADRTPMAWQ
ncbi:MAG: Nif3-like dinuclear metal center hexameric protein [Planctomycetota bacterium]